jgi:uncharacterized protein
MCIFEQEVPASSISTRIIVNSLQSEKTMSVALPSVTEIALESKVTFLRQPASYPEHSYRVEAIETHMSWVFLTNGYAYKLKKPVCYDDLDFRTIEARRHYCEEEVHLNRRLAGDIYVGTVALSIDAHGHMQLGESKTIIDWLVKMRRLPTEHMLDYAIKHGTVHTEHIRSVAHRLALFYRRCPPIAINADDFRSAFLRAIDCNQDVMTRTAYRLPQQQIMDLCRMQRMALNNKREWFDARVRAGKIVEGHGDLRPEHISLEPEIAIIDCLEFSRALRLVDPADELGFLALECERLGAAQTGALLLQTYSEISDDWPNAALVHFYQSFRASVRARIAIKHLDEEKFRYSAEWRRRANDYLQLAEKYQNLVNSVMGSPA